MSVSQKGRALNLLFSKLFRRAASAHRAVTAERPGDATATPIIALLDGGEVALEVLQAISYRTVLKSATIVSYNMQDYAFWSQGTLSHLLLRQLAFGASIRLMTTPPPGKPAKAGFKDKYILLSSLQKSGVTVYLNDKLHAKAYLFQDSKEATTAIVGSAHLTGPGFGLRHAPDESLVEMAALSGSVDIFNAANEFVDKKIVNDRRTEEFGLWFARNSV